MTQLHFPKLSKFDRRAEPATVSIPFAPGKLAAAEQLRVWDGERRLPIQARPLANWPDGSVKWLLVHLQPDLPGNRDKTLRFDLDGKGAPARRRKPCHAGADGRWHHDRHRAVDLSGACAGLPAPR